MSTTPKMQSSRSLIESTSSTSNHQDLELTTPSISEPPKPHQATLNIYTSEQAHPLPDRRLGRLTQLSIQLLLLMLILLLLLLLNRPSLLGLPAQREVIAVLDRDALGHVVDFVDADEPLGEFKHVVAQADDDELRVLGAFLDVARDD